MSGVMLMEDLRDPSHFDAAETTIAVNLLGTIRTIDAFTLHLIGRGGADITTVSSGIGFLPFPLMPAYGASKAGVHAYTEALRAQLAGTGVAVTELVPPAVATAGQEGGGTGYARKGQGSDPLASAPVHLMARRNKPDSGKQREGRA
jgi:short-subunit dehydrogenase involved in D-alanine esterification of teichoic acids